MPTVHSLARNRALTIQIKSQHAKTQSRLSEPANSLLPLPEPAPKLLPVGTKQPIILSQSSQEDRLSAQLLRQATQPYKQYLEQFNQLGAPKLRTEEGALEWLAMHLAYLPLQRQDRLHFAIEKNLRGQALDHYGETHEVKRLLIDNEHGCVAYLLLPQTQRQEEKIAIIIFRGTTRPCKYLNQRSLGYPTGLKADFDPHGIGYQAFAHNRSTLLDWCQYALDQGYRITLTGHSLGGVFAKRLAAALPPLAQAKLKIMTFNSPGIDSKTAKQISQLATTTAVRNPLDLVVRFGETLPEGTHLIIPQDAWQPRHLFAHGTPRVAISELDDLPFHFAIQTHRSDVPHQWSVLEEGRKQLGHLLHEHIIP